MRVDYTEGEAETYVMPLALARAAEAEAIAAQWPQAVLARVHAEDGAAAGVLYDPLWERVFCEALLGLHGPEVAAGHGGHARRVVHARDPPPARPEAGVVAAA